MAESNALKILFVLDILKRTDESHPVNSSHIIEELKNKGLKAERKSIGKYVQILRDEMDYDIVLCDNKNLGWFMRGQMFEDYELKMLAGSVASAKFLTIENSRKLIKKILTLATKEGEEIIKATTIMDSSLKLTDTKFAIKFDLIMRAIFNHVKVSFKYMEWSTGNKLVPRKNGKTYTISPYYLGVWGYEYFVVANTDPYDNVSVYRVELISGRDLSIRRMIKKLSKRNLTKKYLLILQAKKVKWQNAFSKNTAGHGEGIAQGSISIH